MCTENQKSFGKAKVLTNETIANNVFHLVVDYSAFPTTAKPMPGQFFMLKSAKSEVFLTRPISIYKIEENAIHFLILQKGKGTSELCSLAPNDIVLMIGPLGNSFLSPQQNQKVAIIGGGIGVAPVAGFASTLQPKTYDFYASFKTGSYGLENIFANQLVVSTDDGSVGTKGMLPSIFNAATIQNEEYEIVYACGPEPMLKYVQEICKKTNVKCFLSMEERMACGVGACLGCVINTTKGNQRCCKDGPVFEGDILIFKDSATGAARTDAAKAENIAAGANCAARTDAAKAENIAVGANCAARTDAAKAENAGSIAHAINAINAAGATPKSNAIDLSVNIAGVHFQNPVIAASGTFGFGKEYSDLLDINRLGGICSKGLTLEPKPGNTGTRIVETPAGIINSIGLQNPGIPHFIQYELPEMLKFKATAIANLSGSSIEAYVEGAKLLDKTQIPLIELNISCPNVKKGGMGFGLEPDLAFEVVSAVRSVTKKPIMVKLSPNAPYLLKIVEAVINGGADAISLVNTFQALAINIENANPIFDNIRAGLSGPAIKPIALRMAFDVCQFVKTLPNSKQVPIVGLGGISCWQDAVEFILAGCSAIQVGTATFTNPKAMTEIIDGIAQFMQHKGYNSIEDFKGLALK